MRESTATASRPRVWIVDDSPTEAAIICAAHRLGGEAAARQMVGRPLGNAALYVVERGGTVAPVGVPG